jgi:hypothetical protein
MEENEELDSDFNFYEPQSRGKMPYVNKYPGTPIVKVTGSLVSVSENAQIKIGVNKKSEVGFSEKDGIFYISVLPIDSKIKGFKVWPMENTKSIYLQCKSLIKKGFPKGFYEISESVYHKGIDWYELKPFEF